MVSKNETNACSTAVAGNRLGASLRETCPYSCAAGAPK
jgi:hypothetical protein